MAGTTASPLVLQEMIRRGLQTIRPGLSRMEAVCAALGHPEDRLGTVVHVAGTNGKGSACAFLEAILLATGSSTALFTSPHLVDVCERVRLDGNDITANAFDRAAAEVLAAEGRCGIELTGFEFVTAAGFVAIAHHRPDFAIIEVGMGGQLDATNVIKPALAVITQIAVDHTAYLGTDLATIAAEKSGVVKLGAPCLTAAQVPDVKAVLEGRCAELQAPLIEAGTDFHWGGGDAAWAGQFGTLRVGPLTLSLPGSYQQENAALAVAAAVQILGPELTAGVAAAGLGAARWPGRFQLQRWKGRTLLLDGAHNPHALAAFLSSFQSRYDYRPDVLFALKEDKDAPAMTALLGKVARWVVCTTAGTVASVPAADLARHLGQVPTAVEPDLDAALGLLVAREGNNVVACCGSFYLIGALLRRLRTATENSA